MSATTQRRPTLTLKNPPPARPQLAPAKVVIPDKKPPRPAKHAKPAKPAKPAAKPVRQLSDKQRASLREAKQAAAKRKRESQRMLLAIRALAPDLFDPKAVRPLAVRIDKPICAALGVPARKVAPSLKWWTAQRSYLRAVMQGGPRYGLDGAEAGVISEAEQAYARARLKLPPLAASVP